MIAMTLPHRRPRRETLADGPAAGVVGEDDGGCSMEGVL
jgi:hypothetical protein